jgi:hypothetical protein
MNRHFKKIARRLSLVEGFDASVDGITLPREMSLLPVRGKTFNFEQMESEYNERRGMGEFAAVTVPRVGGLVPGARGLGRRVLTYFLHARVFGHQHTKFLHEG